MKGTMLLMVVLVGLLGLPVVWDRSESADAAVLHGSNHTWNWNWLPWGGPKDRAPKTRNVPIPGTLLLFGTGLFGLAIWRYREDK
jgi:hypothetical protein